MFNFDTDDKYKGIPIFLFLLLSNEAGIAIDDAEINLKSST